MLRQIKKICAFPQNTLFWKGILFIYILFIICIATVATGLDTDSVVLSFCSIVRRKGWGENWQGQQH